MIAIFAIQFVPVFVKQKVRLSNVVLLMFFICLILYSKINFATESGFNGSSNSMSVYTFRIRGEGGEILREFLTEYDNQGNETWQWVKDGIYHGGRLLASDGNNLSVKTSRLSYHHDYLGSTRYVATDGGQMVGTYTYGPYGELLSEMAAATEQKFTGQERDTETLDYMKARYYNVDDGRFLTPDPGREGWNLYSYARNNPVTRVDPSGLYSRVADYKGNVDPDDKPKFGSIEEHVTQDTRDRAEVAECVYRNECNEAAGFVRVMQFHGKEVGGFKAALFLRKGDTSEQEYILAYAGTDGAQFDKKDFLSDLELTLGHFPESGNKTTFTQQEKAMRVAAHAKRIVQHATNSASASALHIVGHSLGGNLASTAAVYTGSRATTFNAAGTNTMPLRNAGIRDIGWANVRKRITNFRIEGEIVTAFQEGANGGRENISWAFPTAAGTQVNLPGKGNTVSRHFMGSVIAALDQILLRKAMEGASN